METPGFDVTVVGHFSIDSILLPSRSTPFVVLGGSPAYVSFIAKRLDGTVYVISRVGEDFPEAYMWWLRQEGVDLSGVKKVENERTTRFELSYSKDLRDRTLRLKNKSSPITLSDAQPFPNTKAVHIAPIAGEVDYEVIKHLKKGVEILSLDPQGLLRSFDEAGNVTHKSHVDSRILGLTDIFKSSKDEIRALTGHSNLSTAIKTVHDQGVEIVVVTLGAQGAMLSIEDAIYKIPAYNSGILVDPTGAGDVFIGGFLTEYVRKKDAPWCACVGSAAASLVVEGVGPTFFGEKEEIYRRANFLYDELTQQ